jgi:hypothetical protein
MDGAAIDFSPNRFILFAILLAGGLAYAGAETGAAMISLDQMIPGMPPAGFTFARTGQGNPAQWSVTDDATAPSHRTIEQVSTDRTPITGFHLRSTMPWRQ